MDPPGRAAPKSLLVRAKTRRSTLTRLSRKCYFSEKNALAARAFASQNTCEVPMRRFSNQNRKVAWRDALFLSTRTMETWLGDWLYR